MGREGSKIISRDNFTTTYEARLLLRLDCQVPEHLAQRDSWPTREKQRLFYRTNSARRVARRDWNSKEVLSDVEGSIYFEYAIPRMGKRIDVVLLIGPVIFVLEFKVGESAFSTYALDQVCDYALDLKNFHESSYNHFIAPVLIPTAARRVPPTVYATPQNDKLFSPIRCTVALLGEVIDDVLHHAEGEADIDPEIMGKRALLSDTNNH